ncbi:hypothetical protein V2I01_28805 [Micromonospora sp. BRA006-A]|nr:hypothetical protein [Micromonospora sp. BRA006-A]
MVLNWAPACRDCWHCRHGEPWLCAANPNPSTPRGETAAGEPLEVTLGLGALAEEVVVPQRAAVPVPAGLPPEQAAVLGCAVLTGVGAVRNTARVAPGESVAVIGLGGVGLAVLTAARRAGASPILAVDVVEAKRDLALAAGATGFLRSDDRLGKGRSGPAPTGAAWTTRSSASAGPPPSAPPGGRRGAGSGHCGRHGRPRRHAQPLRAGHLPLRAHAALLGVRLDRPGPGGAGTGRRARRR